LSQDRHPRRGDDAHLHAPKKHRHVRDRLAPDVKEHAEAEHRQCDDSRQPQPVQRHVAGVGDRGGEHHAAGQEDEERFGQGRIRR
jgi:hypothetical protein